MTADSLGKVIRRNAWRTRWPVAPALLLKCGQSLDTGELQVAPIAKCSAVTPSINRALHPEQSGRSCSSALVIPHSAQPRQGHNVYRKGITAENRLRMEHPGASGAYPRQTHNSPAGKDQDGRIPSDPAHPRWLTTLKARHFGPYQSISSLPLPFR